MYDRGEVACHLCFNDKVLRGWIKEESTTPSSTEDKQRSNGVRRRALMAGYGAEQPVLFAVDPVGEVEGIGAAVAAADPELDRPKAARGVAARIDRERPVQLPVARYEGVDFAMAKAEVADQHIVAEPAETGRCQGDPPRRGEAAAYDQFLDEVADFIEDCNGPLAQLGDDLGGASGGRIRHVNVAADVLHVERDEPFRQRGVDECAGCEAQRDEGTVEHVDCAERGIGSIKARLRTVDRKPGV